MNLKKEKKTKNKEEASMKRVLQVNTGEIYQARPTSLSPKTTSSVTARP